MQLLFQEFFKKIFKISEESNFFFIKFLVRFIFYLIIAVFLILVIWSIYSGNYLIMIIIFAILIIGELAHYIRKSREKAIVENIMPKRIKSR
jgi:hypothetical protein